MGRAKKYTIEDMQRFAINKGGRCISVDYINFQSKLQWECGCGHIWSASYSNISRGKWCKRCAGTLKLTIEYMREVAERKGGKCLSSEYTNNKAKLKWECELGHEWFANYANISQGRWCPECRGGVRKDLQYAQSLAEAHGGKCLSDTYVNSVSKILWRCEHGHEWLANCNNVGIGHWCPYCKDKTQTRLTKICEDILGVKAEINYKPDWLRNPDTKQKQEVDIFFSELKIGIEYNGEQHYCPVRFGGMSAKQAQKQFEYIQKMDNIKKSKVKKNKDKIEHFIVFSYKEEISPEYVRQKLAKTGVLKGDNI